jgi:hypothetical protein
MWSRGGSVLKVTDLPGRQHRPGARPVGRVGSRFMTTHGVNVPVDTHDVGTDEQRASEQKERSEHHRNNESNPAHFPTIVTAGSLTEWRVRAGERRRCRAASADRQHPALARDRRVRDGVVGAERERRRDTRRHGGEARRVAPGCRMHQLAGGPSGVASYCASRERRHTRRFPQRAPATRRECDAGEQNGCRQSHCAPGY